MHIEIDATEAPPTTSSSVLAACPVRFAIHLSTSSTGGAALLKEVDDNTGEATVLTWSDELGTTRQMHFTLEVRGGGTAPTQLVG